MLAKADPTLEKKFVEIILFIFVRRQGIAKTLRLKKAERGADDGARIWIRGSPRLRQLAHGRTNQRRNLKQGLAFAWVKLFLASRWNRYDLIFFRFSNGLTAPKIMTRGKPGAGRWFDRPIQCKDPVGIVRLQRDPLSNGFLARPKLRGVGQGRRRVLCLPFQAFALRHDNAAPIQRAGWWYSAVGKLGTESHF